MTRNYYNNYKTETFDKEHNHLGGIICLSDFCTEYRENKKKYESSSVAQKIASDFRYEQKMFKQYMK